jgi:hypothetical protein
MLDPRDYDKTDKSFVYVPVQSKKPICIEGRDENSFAFKVVLLDATTAMSKLVYNRHDGHIHHHVFYDDPRFLRSGSISGRIAHRISNVRGTDVLYAKAKLISESMRTVRFAELRVRTRRMPAHLCEKLLGELALVPEEIEQTVRTKKRLFKKVIDASFYGPVVPILNIEEIFQQVGARNYHLQFHN